MKRRGATYKGKGEEHGIAEWSVILRVSEKTLRKRLRRGETIDEIAQIQKEGWKREKRGRPTKLYEYQGEWKTANEWAELWGVTRRGALGRLSRTQSEQTGEAICWHCNHAAPGSRCTWIQKLKMVPGATFVTKETYYEELTVITSCPKFTERRR